jgi:hypothetical protein
MKNISKILTLVLMLAFALLSSACNLNEEDAYVQREKPSRDTSGSKIPWVRPASWEGGLPGMGSGNNMPNQY